MSEVGGSRTLYLAIFSAVLGMLQYGFGIGVINAPQKIIEDFIKKSFKSRYDIELDESGAQLWFSLAVTGAIVGGLIGAISGGSIADKMGRKKGLLIAQGPSLIGSVFMGVSQVSSSVELLLIGRLLFGISCGWFTALAPMYVSEIAPLRIRGAMGTVNQLAVTSGILISMVLGLKDVLGTSDGWPILLALSAVPAILQTVILPFMPESPVWLINVKKDMDGGRTSLKRLNRSEADIDSMVTDLASGQSGGDGETNNSSMSIFQFLRQNDLRLALFVCVSLHLSQQLSGMVAIFYYSTSFFQSAGLDESTSQYATLGVGAILVTMTFITIPLMDRLGRRVLHLTGLAGIVVCSICITVALTLQASDKDNQSLGVFLIAVTLIFVAFFAFGPGSIPWMAAGEMFTQEGRGPATSLCVFVNWLGNLTVGLVFPQLQGAVGSYSFIPFLAITTILLVLLYLYFPETKGLSPQQVQDILTSANAWKRPVGLRGPHPEAVSSSSQSSLLVRSTTGPENANRVEPNSRYGAIENGQHPTELESETRT